MANTVDISKLRTELEMDTTNFDQGTAKAQKDLKTLDSSFQKTQTQIKNSLDVIDSSVRATTRQVQTSVKVLREHVEAEFVATRKSISSLGTTITKVNNSTKSVKNAVQSNTKAIKELEKSLVSELSKIVKAFERLDNVSSKDFSKGIKSLTSSITSNSKPIKNHLKEIENQATRTAESIKKVGTTRMVIPVTRQRIAPVNTGNTPSADESGNKSNGFLSSLTSNFKTVLGNSNKFLDTMTKASFQVFLIRQAFYQIKDALGAIIGPGLEFASQMETLQLGYAGIISSTLLKNGKEIPYKDALEISSALLQRMQDEALKTSLTIEELGNALQSTMAIGINAGMSLQEVLDLTVVGAQAVKTFGLSNQQVVQELRGLISGEAIRPGVDMLATVLGYNTKTVNTLREQGKLYEDIMQRMAGFKATSEEYQNTISGLFSNLKDGVSRVFGEAMKTSGLFESIKETLKGVQAIFFDITKEQQKLDNGKVVDVFKVKINENTLNIVKSLYKIFSDFGKALAPVISLLGKFIALIGGKALIALSAMAQALHLLSLALTPLWTALDTIYNVLLYVVNAILDFITNINLSNETLTNLTIALGVVGTAALAFINPVLAIGVAFASVFGGAVLAVQNLGDVWKNFSKYFSAKVNQIIANAKALKASFEDLVRVDRSAEQGSDKPYLEEAKKYAEEADRAFNDLAKSGSDAYNKMANSIGNSFASVKKGASDIKKSLAELAKGLSSKFPAGKDGKTDTNGKTDTKGASRQAKSAYKALESAYKQLETLAKEQQEKLDSYYKNDLISTQNYIDNKYTLQKLLLESEIKNLEERKKVAERLGQESDVENFNSKIATAKDSLGNLEAKMTRESIEEYKKLEDRLDSIKSKYEELFGVTQKGFEYNLAKEFSKDITRVNAEIETALDRLKSAEERNNETEKKIWAERLARLKETQKQQKEIIALKGLEREAELAKAEIQKIDLDVQAKFIEKQDQVNRLAQTQAELDGDLFLFRKEHMDEYIDQYTTLIAKYETMARMAKDTATQNKYKQMALEAREAMYQLADAVPPFQKAMKEQFIGSLSDAFQSMLWQEKTAKEAFEDFAKSILQTWSKKVFDEVATAMTDGLFQGLLPKGEKTANVKLKTEEIVQAKVQVNMEDFKNKIINSAIDIQQSLTNNLIPAVNTTAQSMQNLATHINNLVGVPNGIPQPTENVPNLNVPNLLAEKTSYGDVSNNYAYSFDGTTSSLKDFKSYTDKLSNSTAGLTTEFTDVTQSMKLGKLATDATTDASKQAGEFAIPMMITSLLSASGTLGKFGVVMQGVMMAMQIGKMAGLWKFADGGYVSGAGTATSDSIPARLSNGEYVLKASSVKALGTDFLDTLNNVGGYTRSSKLPKFAFADGGYVNATQNAPQEGIENIPKTIQSSPQVVMNMTFQSLDPESNMKMMEAQYPSIRNRLIRDLQSNASMRTAVKGASK